MFYFKGGGQRTFPLFYLVENSTLNSIKVVLYYEETLMFRLVDVIGCVS